MFFSKRKKETDQEVKDKRLFNFLSYKVSHIDHEHMWKGITIGYLNTILEVCNNDKSLNYKDVLYLFSDFNEIIKYKESTKNNSNILLLENYFNKIFPNMSVFENDTPLKTPFLKNFEHMNLFFTDFIKEYKGGTP